MEKRTRRNCSPEFKLEVENLVCRPVAFSSCAARWRGDETAALRVILTVKASAQAEADKKNSATRHCWSIGIGGLQ